MKLLIVVNVDWFFLSHRLPVALAAQQKGWDVTIVTADTGQLKTIEAKGLRTVNLPMSRSGMNLLQELNTCWFLYKLYRRHQPDVVHHVAIKTILWGTLAAKFAKVHGVVNAISGRFLCGGKPVFVVKGTPPGASFLTSPREPLGDFPESRGPTAVFESSYHHRVSGSLD